VPNAAWDLWQAKGMVKPLERLGEPPAGSEVHHKHTHLANEPRRAADRLFGSCLDVVHVIKVHDGERRRHAVGD